MTETSLAMLPGPNRFLVRALELGLAGFDKGQAKPLVATDPDADRMGTPISHNGDYVLLPVTRWASCLWIGFTMVEERGEKPYKG